MIAVVTVQAILGAHPQESRAILQHRLYREVLEPLLFAVELEVIALSPRRRRCETASSESNQPDWTQTRHSYILNSAVLLEFIRRYDGLETRQQSSRKSHGPSSA
jgi:hypothetical protein